MGEELSQRVPIVNILHTQQVKTPLLVKAQDFGEFVVRFTIGYQIGMLRQSQRLLQNYSFCNLV